MEERKDEEQTTTEAETKANKATKCSNMLNVGLGIVGLGVLRGIEHGSMRRTFRFIFFLQLVLLSQGSTSKFLWISDLHLDPFFGQDQAVAVTGVSETCSNHDSNELFPYGPAKQACKYAGLPKPTGCV